ncbi:MAG: OprO/OprP family phosphate-selective porin [Armatimonadetes bacterium]|nr:OprO/OprP family phosphate-selective porin [Armatimonadota bacterium]
MSRFRGVLMSIAFMFALQTGPLLAQQVSPDRAYVDAVLDGLVKAGVLSQQQAQQIRADAVRAAEAAAAQAPEPAVAPASAAAQRQPKRKPWYETMKISGYTQARAAYFEDYPNPEASKGSSDFAVARARTVFSFQPSDLTDAYFQLDFGRGEPTVKDAWVQRALSAGREWRWRLGQQKVPFGFETPQSDNDRLPFERTNLSTTLFPGNRDTGLVLYYTRPQDAALFASGREVFGAGDFGNFAIGLFNGQGAAYRTLDTGARVYDGAETNSNKHLMVRFAKPFSLGAGGRYAEAGVSYWHGRYRSAKADREFDDRMLGLHAYLAPAPWGLQAEYFTGKTEGGDVDAWYGMGLLRAGRKGLVFARYEDYEGPRKGKGVGNIFDRQRWCLGYAYDLDPRTRLTLEYDIERVEAAGNQPAFHNDVLGVQLQATY